jgi:hypothetical protein
MPRGEPLNTTDHLQVVRLDDLVLLDALQVRVRIDPHTVSLYRDIFLSVPEDKCTCPPIIVYKHQGTLVVSDGHHRVAAAKLAKRTTLKAYVRPSTAQTLDDAWLSAMRTNIRHGIPYTREDREKIVIWFLEHPAYRDRSSRQIADLTGNLIPHSTVANIRNRHKMKQLEAVSKLDSRSMGGPTRAESVHQMQRAVQRIRSATGEILGVALDLEAPEELRRYAREMRQAAVQLAAVLAQMTDEGEDAWIPAPAAEDEDED